jgi:hypothetical protein
MIGTAMVPLVRVATFPGSTPRKEARFFDGSKPARIRRR